jgi:hypothetical protein
MRIILFHHYLLKYILVYQQLVIDR